jgi:hypothetical protein
VHSLDVLVVVTLALESRHVGCWRPEVFAASRAAQQRPGRTRRPSCSLARSGVEAFARSLAWLQSKLEPSKKRSH